MSGSAQEARPRAHSSTRAPRPTRRRRARSAAAARSPRRASATARVDRALTKRAAGGIFGALVARQLSAARAPCRRAPARRRARGRTRWPTRRAPRSRDRHARLGADGRARPQALRGAPGATTTQGRGSCCALPQPTCRTLSSRTTAGRPASRANRRAWDENIGVGARRARSRRRRRRAARRGDGGSCGAAISTARRTRRVDADEAILPPPQ